MNVAALNRTLDQELTALLRGASLECPVCGEFVLHEGARIRCPECGVALSGDLGNAGSQLEFGTQAG